jgi:hypothetical protein
MPMTQAELWQALREKVVHEDKWIQQRVNWLIAADAFLLAGYAALGGFPSLQGYSFAPLGLLLALGLPLFGSLVSLFVLIGLRAAHLAMDAAEDELERLIPAERVRQRLPAIRSSREAHTLGQTASFGIAFTSLAIWVIILAINIMRLVVMLSGR